MFSYLYLGFSINRYGFYEHNTDILRWFANGWIRLCFGLNHGFLKYYTDDTDCVLTSGLEFKGMSIMGDLPCWSGGFW
jgi:hypothetical protein